MPPEPARPRTLIARPIPACRGRRSRDGCSKRLDSCRSRLRGCIRRLPSIRQPRHLHRGQARHRPAQTIHTPRKHQEGRTRTPKSCVVVSRPKSSGMAGSRRYTHRRAIKTDTRIALVVTVTHRRPVVRAPHASTVVSGVFTNANVRVILRFGHVRPCATHQPNGTQHDRGTSEDSHSAHLSRPHWTSVVQMCEVLPAPLRQSPPQAGKSVP